ncbi:JAB domain-containing protein [Neobacillus bataviensis]|uniref:JAB domain-containing protein n=1 Tax=Neobacillus bataviensis TaxID=220685 RepID=UPI000A072926|nr:JAB domain-containing protein [Neobacillus bataviensis]
MGQKFAASYIADENQEVLLVLRFNTKNQVVGLHRAHVGSLNASLVHPRKVILHILHRDPTKH